MIQYRSFGRRLLGVGAVSVLACGGSPTEGNGPPGPPASLSVAPSPSVVRVGSTLPLQATVRDANGNILSGQTPQWSTSDAAKATVSSGGIVTGRSQGTLVITASLGTVSGTTSLTVVPLGSGQLHEIFSTYLGGTGDDMVRDVAFDAQGNLYLTGSTDSPNLTTTPGVFDRSFNTGGQPIKDAFVMKLSPTGQLIWSTYLGGPNYERGYAIEVDPQGNVIVAGRAGAGLPVTPGAFQTTFMGGTNSYGAQDGFVCKIQSDGTTILWCSYFGTSDPNIIRDVAVDQNGDIYLASSSASGPWPSGWFTGYQTTRRGGEDGVVAKVSADGRQLLWATYVGGLADEGTSPSIRVNASGVYFLTETQSSNMPTANGFDRTLGGPKDLFLAKLSLDGKNLLFATYVGGSQGEVSETHGLALDNQGNAFVAAQTYSPDFPTTPGSFQPSFQGGLSDAFVIKFSSTGQRLAATYVGGASSDGAEGVMADPQGRVYFAGNTGSSDFPLTVASPPAGLLDLVGVQLAADLSQLLFSVRLGGSANEIGRTVGVDALGNFVVAGQTSSSNYPTMNAGQTSYGGVPADGVVVIFQP